MGLGPLGLVWRPSGLFIPWKISTLTFPPACVWPPHHDLATTPLPAGIPSEARGSSERAHPEQKEEARTARAASREQQGASSGCSPAASRGWLGGCDFAIAGGCKRGESVEMWKEWKEWNGSKTERECKCNADPAVSQSVACCLHFPFSALHSSGSCFLVPVRLFLARASHRIPGCWFLLLSRCLQWCGALACLVLVPR